MAGNGGRRARSIRAEAAFRARMAELGCTILGPYLGTKTPVEALCCEGHACRPWPSSVLAGHGVCAECAFGRWKIGPEADFRAKVEAAGGTVLGVYVNSHAGVLVRCKAGHECWPQPGGLTRGRGFCSTCVGHNPGVAAAAFRARMASMGATPLGEYVNAHTPVPAICAAGHDCVARPHDVRKGFGICRICAGQDPATAEAAFRARLAELGAALLEPKWLGATTPHRVRCAQGHESKPWPSGVVGGQGICPKCAGKEWDAFYTVTSWAAVKFGITGGDGHARLAVHRKRGYHTVVRLLTGLLDEVGHDSGGDAGHDVENTAYLLDTRAAAIAAELAALLNAAHSASAHLTGKGQS